jgi:hypothetical protein
VAGNLPVRFHAIYTVLGELDLLKASIASVYEFVDGITIATTYDRDWKGAPVAPDGLVGEILARTFDPARKIDLLVSHETSEARNRNRAMDFAVQTNRRIVPQHSTDVPPPDIDYFWLIDADEIYSSDDIPRLASFIAKTRKSAYQIASTPYFRTWNHRVPVDHFATVFLRSDVRLAYLRNPHANLVRRVLARAPVSQATRYRIRGLKRIPAELGRFHHGSYVGPRERIADKLASFGHSDDIASDWLQKVWDSWSPASTNFHPTQPSAFPSSVTVPTDELPRELRDWHWPEGYLDEIR